MNLDNLSPDEQKELLKLLEEEDGSFLILYHRVPRPPRPGQIPQLTDGQSNFVLRVPIAQFKEK